MVTCIVYSVSSTLSTVDVCVWTCVCVCVCVCRCVCVTAVVLVGSSLFDAVSGQSCFTPHSWYVDVLKVEFVFQRKISVLVTLICFEDFVFHIHIHRI